MQRTGVDPITIRRFVALGTEMMIIIAVLLDHFGSRQIFDPMDSDIGDIFSRT
jgi:hypothetical protein